MNRLHNHAQLTIDIGTEVRSQNNLLEDMVRRVALRGFDLKKYNALMSLYVYAHTPLTLHTPSSTTIRRARASRGRTG